MIESSHCRLVHLLFNPGQACPMTPFTKRMLCYLNGNLDETLAQDNELLESYIERLLEERLEEGETSPIKFEDNCFFEMELNMIDQVSFAVADNPFVKSDTPRFQPELYVVSKDGKISGHIASEARPGFKENREIPEHDMEFVDNFRDDKLKINDDRKIRFSLNQQSEAGTNYFMVVRVNDSERTRTRHYEQAWFRLQNEETNQTLDYSKFKDIPLPEGMDPEAEEENQEQTEGELLYIIGRIYSEEIPGESVLDDEGNVVDQTDSGLRFVYEKWNKCVNQAKYPDLLSFMADAVAFSEKAVCESKERIEKAKEELVRLAEERRQAQLAALAKKNEKQNNKKKGKSNEVEAPIIDAPKEVPKAKDEERTREYDLNDPKDFADKLRKGIPRAFTFGPVMFDDLDNPDFDIEEVYAKIDETMESPTAIVQDYCIHGYQVLAKGRRLKRPTTLLKHARFLQNLQVLPNYPSV